MEIESKIRAALVGAVPVGAPSHCPLRSMERGGKKGMQSVRRADSDSARMNFRIFSQIHPFQEVACHNPCD